MRRLPGASRRPPAACPRLPPWKTRAEQSRLSEHDIAIVLENPMSNLHSGRRTRLGGNSTPRGPRPVAAGRRAGGTARRGTPTGRSPESAPRPRSRPAQSEFCARPSSNSGSAPKRPAPREAERRGGWRVVLWKGRAYFGARDPLLWRARSVRKERTEFLLRSGTATPGRFRSEAAESRPWLCLHRRGEWCR